MKRMAQLVAVLGIAILAVQPVLASQPCIFGAATDCVSDCPMEMAAMGPDCSMQSPMAELGCPQNCCAHGEFQAAIPVVAQDKSRSGAPSPLLMLGAAPASANSAVRAQVNNEPRGVSPQRYILNQVFRI